MQGWRKGGVWGWGPPPTPAPKERAPACPAARLAAVGENLSAPGDSARKRRLQGVPGGAPQ